MTTLQTILAGVEIAIETFSLAMDDAAIEALRRDITADESTKIARLISPQKQRRAIAARGQLRRILGTRLNCAPLTVPLGIGTHGKPYIAEPSASLHFNLAHSGDAAVLAICGDTEIGIDIEPLRDIDLNIGRAILSAQEQLALDAIESSSRSARLLERWTMKEAVLKAVGCGFQRTPTSFDLGSFDSDHPVSIAAAPFDAHGTIIVTRLTDLWPGHAVSLAVHIA
ncbi:MAG TPA: 4'-phosphopantetheinyl transferase superfamily protein [Magnetospirillaceae bacterium]|jgi:4'-phosphopantetheinyl transferase